MTTIMIREVSNRVCVEILYVGDISSDVFYRIATYRLLSVLFGGYDF